MRDRIARTILIAEPNHAVRRMLDRAFRSAGYDTLLAPDATSASQLLRENRKSVHLLVAAGTINPMSGVELADWATQLEHHLKVLILSASGRPIPLRPTWRQLAKPFSLRTLLDTVHELLA